MYYIHNATLITPEKTIYQGAILIEDETISAIGTQQELTCPAGAESVDADGLIIAPGLIDLQVNGAFGMDFTSQPDTIWQVGERLLQFGVTTFLPTIVSSPLKTIQLAQAVLHKGPPAGYQGARVPGLHLEGPYLSLEKYGAHNPADLCLPEVSEYQGWNPGSYIRMVTLAPELPGALPAIRILVRNGVVVSAGHSQANLRQAQAGIKAGIRYATHLFNAMPPLDHRQPGLAGAVCNDARLTAGLIVDGIHIHPTMVQLAWKILGTQHTNLVTDAVAALGMPTGEFDLGGRTITHDGVSARLKDGRLAGSLLSLDQAVRNLVRFTGCNLAEALHTITTVPARLLSMGRSLGNLAAGCKADLVMLTPEGNVAGVWINGHKARLPASM